MAKSDDGNAVVATDSSIGSNGSLPESSSVTCSCSNSSTSSGSKGLNKRSNISSSNSSSSRALINNSDTSAASSSRRAPVPLVSSLRATKEDELEPERRLHFECCFFRIGPRRIHQKPSRSTRDPHDPLETLMSVKRNANVPPASSPRSRTHPGALPEVATADAREDPAQTSKSPRCQTKPRSLGRSHRGYQGLGQPISGVVIDATKGLLLCIWATLAFCFASGLLFRPTADHSRRT